MNKSLQAFVSLLEKNHEPGTYCISFITEYLLEELAKTHEGLVDGALSNRVSSSGYIFSYNPCAVFENEARKNIFT